VLFVLWLDTIELCSLREEEGKRIRTPDSLKSLRLPLPSATCLCGDGSVRHMSRFHSAVGEIVSFDPSLDFVSAGFLYDGDKLN
jgi:hypothetical protein